MLDLNSLPLNDLEKIQKVLEIVLNTLKLQGVNNLVGNKIPLEKFEREGFFSNEVITILRKIDNKNSILLVESKYYETKKEREKDLLLSNSKNGITLGSEIEGIIRDMKTKDEDKIYGNIVLRVRGFKEIKRIKNKVDRKLEKLKKIAPKEFPLCNDLTKSNIYKIEVKDRYIWINNYLLSKPYATGTNFEFFEYVRSQPINTKIERRELPNFGSLSLKQQIGSRHFTHILNELGFKGEIKKAFFYKIDKNSLFYRGDKIIKEDLEKAGIKIPLFIKELELAHTKNNPI